MMILKAAFILMAASGAAPAGEAEAPEDVIQLPEIVVEMEDPQTMHAILRDEDIAEEIVLQWM